MSDTIPYDVALQLWGAQRLDEASRLQVEMLNRGWGASRAEPFIHDPSRVIVETNFEEGYDCCGGRDESCYCSMAYGAVHEIQIRTTEPGGLVVGIDLKDFDFATLLREVLQAAGHPVAA